MAPRMDRFPFVCRCEIYRGRVLGGSIWFLVLESPAKCRGISRQTRDFAEFRRSCGSRQMSHLPRQSSHIVPVDVAPLPLDSDQMPGRCRTTASAYGDAGLQRRGLENAIGWHIAGPSGTGIAILPQHSASRRQRQAAAFIALWQTCQARLHALRAMGDVSESQPVETALPDCLLYTAEAIAQRQRRRLSLAGERSVS